MSEYGLLQVLNELSIEYGNAIVSNNESTARSLREIGKTIAKYMIPDTSDGEDEAWYLLGLMNIIEYHVV